MDLLLRKGNEMTTIEIEYLIELAEQSSDPQDIDSGEKAKVELASLRAESEARRVALEQKAEEVRREWTRAENAEAALEEAIRYVKAHPSEDNWDEAFLQKYGDK